MKKPPLWEVIRLGGHALNFGRVQEVHMLLLSCWSVSCWESKAQIFRVGTWEQSVLLFFFGTSAVELSLLVIYHLPVVPEIWGGRGSTCHTHTHTSGWMPSNLPAERLSRAPEFRDTHGELQNTKVSERQRVWWHVWIWYRWCRDAEVWWWEVKWWAPRLIVNGLLTELLFVLLQNVSEQDVLCCERMHRYKL